MNFCAFYAIWGGSPLFPGGFSPYFSCSFLLRDDSLFVDYFL